MKKLIVIIAALVSLTACTNTQKGATAGAVVGGVIGGAASGNLVGAAIGATAGGLAGALLGSVSDQPGKCYYKNSQGQIYIDVCPK